MFCSLSISNRLGARSLQQHMWTTMMVSQPEIYCQHQTLKRRLSCRHQGMGVQSIYSCPIHSQFFQPFMYLTLWTRKLPVHSSPHKLLLGLPEEIKLVFFYFSKDSRCFPTMFNVSLRRFFATEIVSHQAGWQLVAPVLLIFVDQELF